MSCHNRKGGVRGGEEEGSKRRRTLSSVILWSNMKMDPRWEKSAIERGEGMLSASSDCTSGSSRWFFKAAPLNAWLRVRALGYTRGVYDMFLPT